MERNSLLWPEIQWMDEWFLLAWGLDRQCPSSLLLLLLLRFLHDLLLPEFPPLAVQDFFPLFKVWRDIRLVSLLLKIARVDHNEAVGEKGCVECNV